MFSVIDHTFCKLSSISYFGMRISNMSVIYRTQLGLVITKKWKYMMKEKADEPLTRCFIMKLKICLEVLISKWTNNISQYHTLHIKNTIHQEEIPETREKQIQSIWTQNNWWITMGIINMIWFKDRMYKRLRLTRPVLPIYETLEKTSRITIRSSKGIKNAAKNCHEIKLSKYIYIY